MRVNEDRVSVTKQGLEKNYTACTPPAMGPWHHTQQIDNDPQGTLATLLRKQATTQKIRGNAKYIAIQLPQAADDIKQSKTLT